MKNTSIDEIIFKVKGREIKPTLLLHVCCAVCASSVLERLSPHFDLTLLYFNPNISPKAEFTKRFDALKLLLRNYPEIKPIFTEWQNNVFLDAVKGLEHEPEGGDRCQKCFYLRLSEAAKRAKDFDFFSTTLTVSPHKNAAAINLIGQLCAEEHGARYLASDFKKQNGFARSIEISKQLGLYRQSYCGCLF